MEGIVAGGESLSKYDIDLDAGIPASEGNEDVVSFDVELPNGKKILLSGRIDSVGNEALMDGSRRKS
ncbi:hypothetical protein [Paenibacillus sp. yr247]|uniref:hypothetical protein n=1 Tax=Paenibacillus sp. yr247 TaxID=1761880 RepID=UPI000B81B498|nr:hypothetical protein [Paenibacillus sp. yr247]